MTGYLNYLNPPETLAVMIAIVFFIMQIVGEILSFKGKVVPEILNIRKYFKRRKAEKEELKLAISELIKSNQTMNQRLDKNDEKISELNTKLDANTKATLDILIDNKRSSIICFASSVSDKQYLPSHEQFNRVYKTYNEYEKILEQNGLTNGEVDIAMQIIDEAYKDRLANQTFLENVRGYNIPKEKIVIR